MTKVLIIVFVSLLNAPAFADVTPFAQVQVGPEEFVAHSGTHTVSGSHVRAAFKLGVHANSMVAFTTASYSVGNILDVNSSATHYHCLVCDSTTTSAAPGLGVGYIFDSGISLMGYYNTLDFKAHLDEKVYIEENKMRVVSLEAIKSGEFGDFSIGLGAKVTSSTFTGDYGTYYLSLAALITVTYR